MKFGLLSIGTRQGQDSYCAVLGAHGYHLSFSLSAENIDEAKNALPILRACDIVFASGDKQAFLQLFEIDEAKKADNHFIIDTILCIFLRDLSDITSIEGIIRDYYASLNISMSVYRIFLEQGITRDFDEIYDEKKLGITDKFLLSVRKNGAFLDITTRHRNDSKIAPLHKLILDNYFNHIYATSFSSLVELIATRASKNNVKIRFAESFTGGRLAAELTAIAGASNYFVESLVTYCDEAKHARLGVSQSTLQASGAISAETAFEMAKSLIMSGADLALATTGNAGPTIQRGGGVGKCFIAIGSAQKIEVAEYDFCGDREQITQKGTAHALFLLYRKLMLSYNVSNRSQTNQ